MEVDKNGNIKENPEHQGLYHCGVRRFKCRHRSLNPGLWVDAAT